LHLLTRSIAVLTILLAAQACARVPAGEDVAQEETMNGYSPGAANVRLLQDQAAAMADSAADEASAANSAAVLTPGGYSPLPQGPATTAKVFVDAIVHMAKTFESREDMTPTHVAQVTSLAVMPDSRGQRTGIQGKIGSGHYEFAVWKRSDYDPGHSVELIVRPSDVCELSFQSLHDPLIAEGFRLTRNAAGFKPTVYFSRTVASGLGLHVILNTDSPTAPLCVSRVRLEMEPVDG